MKRPGEEEDGPAKKKSKNRPALVISSDDDSIEEIDMRAATPRKASSKSPFSTAMPKSTQSGQKPKNKSPVKATIKKKQPSPVRLHTHPGRSRCH